MEIEKFKEEFFKRFGKQSFRGYPLDQCNDIWEFFLPAIQSRQAAVSGSLPLAEFQDWITEFNWKKYKDLDRWVCLGGRDNLNPKTTDELIEIFNRQRQ